MGESVVCGVGVCMVGVSVWCGCVVGGVVCGGGKCVVWVSTTCCFTSPVLTNGIIQSFARTET